MNKKKIAIVGAGINGLSCAVQLLEAGFDVTVFTEKTTPNTWSNAASAVWMQFKAAPRDKIAKWLDITKMWCEKVESQPQYGIDLLNYKEYYPKSTLSPCWMKDANHDFQPIPKDALPESYVSGFQSKVYRLDSSLLLPFLQEQIMHLDGKIKHQHIQNINDPALENFPIIVNCCGALSTLLTNDNQAFPIRGQYLLIEKIDTLSTIHTCFLDDERYIAIVPRRHDCWLGGTTERSWDFKPKPEVTEYILDQASKLVPAVKSKKLLRVDVGFRSGRNVIRIEKETTSNGKTILHNYGHGGSAFALSRGCAKEILAMVISCQNSDFN